MDAVAALRVWKDQRAFSENGLYAPPVTLATGIVRLRRERQYDSELGNVGAPLARGSELTFHRVWEMG